MILILLGLVSFIAWFISMLAGGGSPLILIPLVSFIFGAQAVAPVITIGLLVGNSQRVLFFWRDIDWQVTLWYLPGAIAGAILGSYIFTQVHLEGLQILIALALLLMVANYWVGKREQAFPVQVWQFLPLAFLYACGSGLIGSTGPIMNPVYLNYGLIKQQMVATKSINVVVVHTVKLITYITLGALSLPYLTAGLIIGLAAIPANWLGQIVLKQLSNEQFRQLVFTVMAISGVLMLWQQRGLLPLPL